LNTFFFYSATMADNDVATKAPESDAQEDSQPPTEAEKISGIQSDTKPDQGAASMGVSFYRNGLNP
jgi:hypothetical protein